ESGEGEQVMRISVLALSLLLMVVTGQLPDEARKPLVEALGGPFLIYRDKVQDELKLSDDQKQKLTERFPGFVQETMQVFDRIKDLKDEEREKAMQEHRRKSEENLGNLLKDTLTPPQHARLFQL